MKFTERLKKNSDFRIAYQKGKSKSAYLLVLISRENGLGISRLGITVSKKVGNSVVRHRVRRLIREAYRLNEDAFLPGMDYVVIAKANAKGKSFQDVEKTLMKTAGNLKVLKEQEDE